ncbi:mannosyltransferase [Legionella lansingensis]|uniref:Mannosyltransferase n=1 Tax=Legionella lansingensis TaxID=45067 RepID=A0A0W0VMV2_9GAMM|nr:glycosyltransferase family 87 protein [Legionella lansingensis]KTD21404.1 hypothetical protein Llan_1567 [Legionella lansingensis]SNV51917.1 mannosyltransferase [Legionella lansingensis]
MNKLSTHIALILFIFVVSIYYVLFFTILTCQYNLDFASFYSAALASFKGENPYRVWLSTYLPVTKELALNLNPPIFLLLFSPLARLSYPVGLTIWLMICFILGLIGATIAFNQALSSESLKKYRLILYVVYLAFFPTIMNISIAQVGTILLFFVMLGYHFYLKNRDSYAGIMWGFIISFKLFPALLLFYVLKQRRFRVFWVIIVTFVLCWLLPLIIYGPGIYAQYYSMMLNISWYKDNWNGSLYGFLSRLVLLDPSGKFGLHWLTTLYPILFVALLMLYLKKMGPNDAVPVNHQPFCLTLVVMLMLSPLSWVYYFPLLIFPLLLTWVAILEGNTLGKKSQQIWLLCLFLINFPINNMTFSNISSKKAISIMDLMMFSSFYFYGLVLLSYFFFLKKTFTGKNMIVTDNNKQQFILITLIIFAFGILIPSTGFFMRLYTACRY